MNKCPTVKPRGEINKFLPVIYVKFFEILTEEEEASLPN
jgi:hypothetical protein